MIKVSRMADYAVVVLASLSQGDGAVKAACGVARDTGLPEPTVSKVMKMLAKGNVIESVRGASGGYRLPKMPGQVSIAEIIVAVDGPIALTACVEDSTDTCHYSCACPVKGRWNGVNRAIKTALEGVTLADMIDKKRAA